MGRWGTWGIDKKGVFGGGQETRTELAWRRAEKSFGVLRGGESGGKPAGFRWGPPGRIDHNQTSGEVPVFINRDYIIAVPNIAEMALLATI